MYILNHNYFVSQDFYIFNFYDLTDAVDYNLYNFFCLIIWLTFTYLNHAYVIGVRGAIIGSLAPYLLEAHISTITNFFASFLNSNVLLQETRKKSGGSRNMGLQNIGCQYNCTPVKNFIFYPLNTYFCIIIPNSFLIWYSLKKN